MATEQTRIVLSAVDRTGQAFASAGSNASKLTEGLGGIAGKATLVAGTVAAVGVAAAAAFTKMAVEATESAAEIDKLSQIAGVSAEAFQELTAVANQYNVTQDALSDGLKELNLRADEFVKTGGGSAAESFQRLGFSADDLNKRLRDAPALFAEIARRMQGLSQAAKIRIADEIFGGQGGEQFVQIFNAGAGAIQRTTDRVRELGTVMDSQTVRAASEANAAVRELGDFLKNSFIKIVAENAEEIKDIVKGLTDFGKEALHVSGILDRSLKEQVRRTSQQVLDLEYKLRLAQDQWEKFGSRAGASANAARVRVIDLNNQLAILYTRLDDLNRKEDERRKKQEKPVKPPAGGEADIYTAQERKRAALVEDVGKIIQGLRDEEERLDADRQTRQLDLQTATQNEALRRYKEEFLIPFQEAQRNRDLFTMTSAERVAEFTRQHHNRMVLDEEATQARLTAIWQSGWQGRAQIAGDVLGQVSVLMQSENKKMFEVGKAAAIAETVINTFRAAQGAYAALAPIPIVGPFLGIAAAAAATVAGLARVRQIKSTKYGGGGASSAGSGGGGRPSIPASGAPAVQNVPAQPTAQQPVPKNQYFNITISASRRYTAEEVRELIEGINEQVSDGVTLNATVAV